MQENAGCYDGGGLRSSEGQDNFSLEKCGNECSLKGATMFRFGRSDGHCKGNDKCRCTCMKAKPDTCEILTTKGMDLYKIKPPTGNCIVFSITFIYLLTLFLFTISPTVYSIFKLSQRLSIVCQPMTCFFCFLSGSCATLRVNPILGVCVQICTPLPR